MIEVNTFLGHQQKKLLDTSRNNYLLNYRQTNKAIEITSNWPEIVFGLLVRQRRLLTLLPKIENTKDEEHVVKEYLAVAAEEDEQDFSDDGDMLEFDEFKVDITQTGNETSSGNEDAPSRVEAVRAMLVATREKELIRLASKLITTHSAEDLKKRQATIHRDVQHCVRELGTNPYYLTLGMLEWVDSRNGAKNLAPLLLIPVELVRENRFANFKIRYTDEEVEFNKTLAEKLQEDFDLDISPPSHLHLSDVRGYFKHIASVIKDNKDNWRIYESTIVLTIFTPQNILMHKDLKQDSWPITAKPESNPTLSKLLNGGFGKPWKTSYRQSHYIDSLVDPMASFQIYDADSSQLMAIHYVKNGRDLIIQGPPGTGKSQTITNIIAQAIGDGKSVLFVAQKETALNVVKTKLDDAGLGHLCLELHGDKTTRGAFLDDIQNALEHYQKIAVAQLSASIQETNLQKLTVLRDQLNSYSEVLNSHIDGEEISVFQCFEELIRLRVVLQDADPPMWPSRNMFKQKHPSSRHEWLPRIETLQRLLAEIGMPQDNVFRFCNYSEDSFLAPEQIKQVVRKSQITLTSLQQATLQLANELRVPPPTTHREAAALIHLSEHLLQAPKLFNVALHSNKWRTHASEITALISALQKSTELQRENNKIVKPDAWTQDVTALQQQVRTSSNPFRRYFNLAINAPDGLAQLCVSKPPANLRDQMALLDVISAYQNYQRTIMAQDALLGELVGREVWLNGQIDWKYLSNLNNWVVKLQQIMSTLNFPPSLLDYIKGGIAFDELRTFLGLARDRVKDHETAVSSMVKQLKLDQAGQFGANHTFVTQAFSSQENLLTSWLGNLNQLKDILDYGRLKADLISEGFSPVIELGETWQRASEFLVDIVKYAWYSHLIDESFRQNTMLASFNRVTHEAAIQQFREIDRMSYDGNKAFLVSSYNEIIEGMETVGNSDVGSQLIFLRQQCVSTKKKQPIRYIMEQAGRVIKTLKPVFMMSPPSVAKFLPPGKIDFDMVIFDEASQIKPEDAMGAILRGGQTVVVGDRYQLPPTNFFSAGTSSIVSESTGVLDGESILDLFYAAGVPETTLLWHYRSQHHSLITPSNHVFYRNNLVVFPSPKVRDDKLGVWFELVPNAVYDRGKNATQTNIIEARHVASAIMHHAATESGLSLGVVALNESQALAIERELTILRDKNRDYEEFFEAENNFLITNLESIQGDEKEVIFISIGYGFSRDGRLTLQFGPISKVGGTRRLNVLTTRAKKRCVVFSSIRGRDILERNPTNEGALFLARYLEYAEIGRMNVYEENQQAYYQQESYQQKKERQEKLFFILNERFNLQEIQELCLALQIDYENVRGGTKKEKTMDLASHFYRRDAFDQLVEVGKRQRPDIDWSELLSESLGTSDIETNLEVKRETEDLHNLARDNTFSNSRASHIPSLSQLEKEVIEVLEKEGYAVETNVGPQNAAIPIAVMDEKKETALVGIEFDGPRYYQARSASERDRLRQEVLEKLQWNIHRIWIIDWYYHKDREISRLLCAVADTKRGER